MITEIVTFKLPQGMTHEDVVANFEKTAPNWKANPDLIRKNYLVDAGNGVAGGVYVWTDRAHAEKWHGEAFRNMVKEIYGSEPELRYFETPIVVDNTTNAIPKMLFEFANREELLRGWLLHAHKCRDRHDLASRRNDTYRYWLGVPAIILAALVGTSVFVSLESTPNNNIKIVLGLASISSAVLASLQTFFDFGSHAESHRTAGVKYKAVIRELEQVLTQPLDQLPPEKDTLFNDLRERLDDMEAKAPVVPEGIYRQIEKRYASIVFSERVATFSR
jgi:hypothetical protein